MFRVIDNPHNDIAHEASEDIEATASIGEELDLVKHISDTADVSPSARIGAGSRIWHLAQVRENVSMGRNCIIGRGAYVGPGVRIGDNSKIQNYALVYEPAVLGEGVFIGPGVILTNDTYPRSITPGGRLKSAEDWVQVGVVIGKGAALGARSVCIAPVTIGEWSSIAAGAVVTKDVPPYALMVGVPARQVGWVGRAGVPLNATSAVDWVCPQTGERYEQTGAALALRGNED